MNDECFDEVVPQSRLDALFACSSVHLKSVNAIRRFDCSYWFDYDQMKHQKQQKLSLSYLNVLFECENDCSSVNCADATKKPKKTMLMKVLKQERLLDQAKEQLEAEKDTNACQSAQLLHTVQNCASLR